MKTQKVITWKDADTAICHAAGIMLQEASVALRGTKEESKGKATDDGGEAEPGMGEDDSKRTWWTWGYTDDEGFFGLDREDSFLEPEPNDPPLDRICWWSFQNLIRMRLKEARWELEDALFPQGKRLRESDQRSRNAVKRRQGSKHGWSTEE